MTLTERTAALGELLEEKRKAYGERSLVKVESIMMVLYPDGIRPDQYRDALIMIRVFDKLSRIAARGTDGRDLGGESPWMDLAGYGVLGWERDEP